ncbi:MAG: hydrogenase nickel incorporation protein HypB [Trueperaceae bacterium]|nr:hydrogenase nickel incorporation protein HypB [Trueperaceae bacterium]
MADGTVLVPPRILELRQNILKKNDLLARDLRQRFAEAGVYVLNLVSGPGAGKTRLLQRTLTELAPEFHMATLVGDLATQNDARRLQESGTTVRQIETGTLCHLEAEMVASYVQDWNLAEIDLLFIENVGNLVCPSSYDLGEDGRVVLFSTTDGEDKPLKYPTLINSADLAIISKLDLAEAAEFDHAAMHRALREMRPDIKILELSAKTGEGLEAWYSHLRSSIEAKKEASHVSGNPR